MDIRRLVGGLSFLAFLTGALLVCLIPGGFFNPRRNPYLQYEGGWPGITPDQPAHIYGFILLGVGAVGFVVLFSSNKPAAHSGLGAPDGKALPPLPTAPEGPGSHHFRR